jgi:large repetitive protein
MRRTVLFLVLALAVAGCATSTAAAPASAPKTYSAQVLADAPAAYWRMDETTGTTMTDASKNGNNGHYDGIVMLGQPGPLAGDGSTAVALDGATGGASVPSSTSLQVNWVTIELWINKRAESDYGFYVAKNVVGGGGVGSGWFELLNNHNTGRLEFRVGGDVDPVLLSTSALALNAWYYVVATYDGIAAKLYINGKLESTLTAVVAPAQTGDPLYIGRRADGFFTNAQLAEIAIYPAALTAERIAAHWQAATATH